MKWILYALLFVILCASLGLWTLQDPGHIEIVWMGFKVQLSVIIAFFLLLLFFLCIFLLIFCLSWFLEVPFRWLSFFRRARYKKAKQELLNLYSAFEAEKFGDVAYYQKRAENYFSKDPFFLWISGNTFEKEGNLLEAEKRFMELTKDPLTAFLGLKGQIRAALHRGDSKLAYILLEQAEKLVPTSPWVLKHFLALAREQKNFRKAEELILSLEDMSYFSSDVSKRQIAYLQYLEASQNETSLSHKEALLRQSHGLNPYLTEATLSLAQLLSDQGQSQEAVRIVENAWGLAPTQVLGDLYLKISSPKNKIEAYQSVVKLTRHTIKSKESLFLLTYTALQAKLWGEARAHLTDLLKQGPSAETYHLFAILELKENQDSKAAIAWLEKEGCLSRNKAS